MKSDKIIAVVGSAADVARLEARRRRAVTTPKVVPNTNTRLPLPCTLLGEDTGEKVNCPTCRGNVSLNVFACKAHPEGATLVKRVDKKACCDGQCKERIAPKDERGLAISFRHGLGDAVNFSHMIPLYIARGYKVAVYCDKPDFAPLFRAAGAEIGTGGIPHPWQQKSGTNKNRHNLTSPGLPNLAGAWDEYTSVRLGFSGQVTTADRQWVDDALAMAQRPLCVLHVQGAIRANVPAGNRNYQPALAAELCHLWHERTGGSVVVLDRNNSTPKTGAIHVRDYNPAQLYELISRADVFAGIDSGPLHFARFTDTPTVGIWTNHYPADYALPPRKNTVHVVSSRHSVRDGTESSLWNTRLAPDDGPSPVFVVDTLLSMIPKPRTFLEPEKPKLEPPPLPPKHPLAIFPDAISHAAHGIRQQVLLSTYDHRPFLHPGDTDYAHKLTNEFCDGYARVKWAVAKVVQPRSICEIGVGGGLAALAFLDAAPDASYIGIDNCRYEDDTGVPLLGHVEEMFAKLNRKGRILRQDSQTMKELPGEFDLVHVDGLHEFNGCRHDVAMALRSGAAWVLVDDARDSQVAAATFSAMLAWRPGCCEWAMFEDSWTGSILIYTGSNAR